MLENPGRRIIPARGDAAPAQVGPRAVTFVRGTATHFADHPVVRPLLGTYLHRREQILYLVFGGWNTFFGYGVWAILQFILGEQLPYLVILLLAWPPAVLNAYIVYRTFVFRSRGAIVREFPRFSLVYVATLITNLALLPVALHVLPFNIYIIQAMFLAAVVVCSYLSHKYFSFGGSHTGQAADPALRDGPAVRRK